MLNLNHGIIIAFTIIIIADTKKMDIVNQIIT